MKFTSILSLSCLASIHTTFTTTLIQIKVKENLLNPHTFLPTQLKQHQATPAHIHVRVYYGAKTENLIKIFDVIKYILLHKP